MPAVVPTVLAASADEYASMLTRAEGLSRRIHVDICDGLFAPNKTIALAQAYCSEGIQLDLHLMIKEPAFQLETALSMHPSLIIFHAESEGDLLEMVKQVQALGIKAGLAVLPTTPIQGVRALVEHVNHVLIFTGTLGQNGGQFQESQLERAAEFRGMNPTLEISVDGGVSQANAASIVSKGVDILYAGGFLQNAADPQAAYETINAEIGT